MTRRTCVTSMPSASAIFATDAARCLSSRCCQWFGLTGVLLFQSVAEERLPVTRRQDVVLFTPVCVEQNQVFVL